MAEPTMKETAAIQAASLLRIEDLLAKLQGGGVCQHHMVLMDSVARIDARTATTEEILSDLVGESKVLREVQKQLGAKRSEADNQRDVKLNRNRIYALRAVDYTVKGALIFVAAYAASIFAG